MSGEATKTVKLSQGYDHGGKRYEELTLRRPIVADLIGARDDAGVDSPSIQEPYLLARMAGVPVELIRGFDYFRDYKRLEAVLLDFQKASLPDNGSAGSGAGGSSAPPGTQAAP